MTTKPRVFNIVLPMIKALILTAPKGELLPREPINHTDPILRSGWIEMRWDTPNETRKT